MIASTHQLVILGGLTIACRLRLISYCVVLLQTLLFSEKRPLIHTRLPVSTVEQNTGAVLIFLD